MIPLAVPLAMQGVKMIGGAVQLYKANKALQELHKQPEPNYAISPEYQQAYAKALAMSNGSGFSAQETAGFNNDLAMNNTATFKNAVDIGGGGMGSTINAGIQYGNINAINQRAGQGAALKRGYAQDAASLAQGLQSQQNLIDQTRIGRRQLLEQTYGAAKAQANENIWGASDSASNSLLAGYRGGNPSTPEVPQKTLNALAFNPSDYSQNDNNTDVFGNP